MQLRPKSFFKALCCIAAAGSFFCGAIASHAQDMAKGIGFATSQQGRIQMLDAEGQTTHPLLHDTLILDGATIETGKNSHIFLALSNGMGVGIAQNSKITFETFVQKPFPQRKERLSYEPSVSIFSIRLISGSLSVATNKLSPLSQARVYLPSGELRLHSATCIVQNDELGDHITACEGTITYYYPNGEEREFIVEPQSIRISPQSAQLSKISATTTLKELPEEIKRMATATEQTSKRVLFKSTPNGNLPQPVLIASPDFFDQPVNRPYEFNE